MNTHRKKSRSGMVLIVAVVALAAAALAPSAVQAAPNVRGIDGNTIVVAGLGDVVSFKDALVGAQARFKRANDTNEVKGYKFEIKEFADDKNDPPTAVSEARRLVTTEQIFALVPNMSRVTPADYLVQAHVPYFGSGYDVTYCGKAADIWGFAISGCLIPPNPKRLPNNTAIILKDFLKKNKGITTPSIALQGSDTLSGKQSIKNSASTYEGAGWKVVYAKGSLPVPPAPPPGDFSPWVQAIMKSNNGQPPDIVYSSAQPSVTLVLLDALKAAGFKGYAITPYYSGVLVKPLQGTIVFLTYAAFESGSKSMQQMKDDIQTFKPGAAYSLAMGNGYLSADFFLQAVKKAGKNLTPENVRKVASKMTYEFKDVVGPTKYPQSFTVGLPSCSTLLLDPNATGFEVAVPYSCSSKQFPVLEKFTG